MLCQLWICPSEPSTNIAEKERGREKQRETGRQRSREKLKYYNYITASEFDLQDVVIFIKNNYVFHAVCFGSVPTSTIYNADLQNTTAEFQNNSL